MRLVPSQFAHPKPAMNPYRTILLFETYRRILSMRPKQKKTPHPRPHEGREAAGFGSVANDANVDAAGHAGTLDRADASYALHMEGMAPGGGAFPPGLDTASRHHGISPESLSNRDMK
ncbi:hypothetical protein GD604_03755 [Desulfolutivibrio sulfoxidireducens]|nr:hypothetical protein GD604_03755 [Desulfolutivibrio sulfoxidireducens]